MWTTCYCFVPENGKGRRYSSPPTGNSCSLKIMWGITMQSNYEAPKLTDLGSVEAMTGATGRTGALDRNFPAGTAFQNLTFS